MALSQGTLSLSFSLLVLSFRILDADGGDTGIGGGDEAGDTKSYRHKNEGTLWHSLALYNGTLLECVFEVLVFSEVSLEFALLLRFLRSYNEFFRVYS